MSDKPPSPEIKAFLVCDQIIHDANTNKRSLIGIFHDLAASQFPATHPSLWIYANLTDGHGRYAFEFRFVDVGRNTVLGSATPPPIDITDPRQTAEFSAQLRNVPIPKPGTYEFHLIANGNLLATKGLRVLAVDAQGRPIPPSSGPLSGPPPTA